MNDQVKLLGQVLLIILGPLLLKHHITVGSDDIDDVLAALSTIVGVVWKFRHFNGAVAASSNPNPTKGNGMGAVNSLLVGLALVAFLFTGCGGIVTKDGNKAHVVNFIEDGTKIRIGQDPVSQMPQLIVGREQADVTVIPILYQTNAAGQISAVVPDVVMSYEFNGRNATFGGMSGTVTISTGSNAVQTTLGGQHKPINDGTGTALPK